MTQVKKYNFTAGLMNVLMILAATIGIALLVTMSKVEELHEQSFRYTEATQVKKQQALDAYLVSTNLLKLQYEKAR